MSKIPSKTIGQFLGKLFGSAARISKSTARGLVRHGTGTLAKNAVKRLRIPIGNGYHLSYDQLNEADQEVVDEIVKYANHFAHEYIEHHEDAVNSRRKVTNLDDILMSHAEEIYEAGSRALGKYVRSAGYDAVTGQVKRFAYFQDEDLLKQAVISVVQEIESQFIEHADK